MSLKIGDIKNFNIKGTNVLGVVIEVSDFRQSIYTAASGKLILPKDVTYSSVRLDPELRSRLEQIGESCKEEIRLKKALRNQEEETEKLKENLRKSLGVLTPEEFVFAVQKNLPQRIQEVLQKSGYSLRGYVHNLSLFVFTVGKRIEMGRVLDTSYSFIDMEYDRTLFIRRNSEEYNKVVASYHKGDLKFKPIDIGNKYKSKESSSLSIGDKDYLYYNHNLEISVNMSQMPFNKESARNIASLIKICK